MKIIIKNCLNCTKEFNAPAREVKRGNGKFCTQKCSSIYNRAHEIKSEPNVICAHCKKSFYMNETKKKNSKSGFHFCCREHKDLAQCIGGIKEIMPPHYGTGSPENTYRRIAFASKPKVCERCSYDKHEAAIIVHHRDHDRSNNDLSNLEVLCAICHAIEHWAGA